MADYAVCVKCSKIIDAAHEGFFRVVVRTWDADLITNEETGEHGEREGGSVPHWVYSTNEYRLPGFVREPVDVDLENTRMTAFHEDCGQPSNPNEAWEKSKGWLRPQSAITPAE